MRVKKHLALLLAAVMAAGVLSGCNWWLDDDEDSSSSGSSSSSSQSTGGHGGIIWPLPGGDDEEDDPPVTYTVTASVSGTGGTVSPASQTVEEGGSVPLTITSNPYYKIDSVTDNGEDVTGKVDDSTYTISNVTKNHTVTVSFASTIDPTKPSTWQIVDNILIVPNGASYSLITSGLFNQVEGFTGIDLRQSGITTIERNAFYGCGSLQTVIMGNMDRIGLGAFTKCDNLKTVTIGNVNHTGGQAFYDCDNLSTVTIGNIGVIDNGTFALCDNLQTVAMGDVKEISVVAFQGCNNIQSITMGNVESIKKQAFDNCIKLADIHFSNRNIPTVDPEAFKDAGTDAEAIYIYSNLGEEDKETVRKWFNFNDPEKVKFYPYTSSTQTFTLRRLF